MPTQRHDIGINDLERLSASSGRAAEYGADYAELTLYAEPNQKHVYRAPLKPVEGFGESA